MIGLDAATGRTIAASDHLAQSIADILMTPLGSRAMRRDYGSMLFELLDQPLNAATRLLVYAATAGALRRWEPRIRLTRVRLDATAGAEGRGAITIEGDRLDVPAANRRVFLSIPIRAGGLAPVNPA